MAQTGIWYDGKYEQWDSYIEKLAHQGRNDRRAARVRRQQDAVETTYRTQMKRDFE